MNIIKIQALFRGYYVRKINKSNKDNFDLILIIELLNSHINYVTNIKNINSKLINRKIRNPNFPSDISENIVKYAFYKKYKIMPCWDTKSGDLKFLNKKIEVKGFSSNGPTSFGPNESWDLLYFVDCTNFINFEFIVYEIKLSTRNKTDTYKNQCDKKIRPRIVFNEFKKQLLYHNICWKC